MFWTLNKLFASIELMMTNFNDTHNFVGPRSEALFVGIVVMITSARRVLA